MRLRGTSLEEIAEFLNKNDYSRQNSKTGKKYTAHMKKEAVRRMMKDPIYAGVVLYGDNVVDLTEVYDFVPVVSAEEFMTINKLEKNSDVIKLARSFKRGDVIKSDLLRGRILCADCNEPKMTGVTTKKLKDATTRRYFYYRCDTDGCRFQNKNTRAKVIVDFAVKFFASKPFSNLNAYEHYKEEMKRLSKERLRETSDLIRARKTELAKAEDRVNDLRSAMVLEKDSEVREYQKDDFHKTSERIIELGEEIARLEMQKDSIMGAIFTYEEFLELFNNMAILLAKNLPMKDMDTILKKSS